MKKYRYPLRAINVKEISGEENANAEIKNGYLILGVRTNRFIVDDGVFDEEFIYSLAKPEDIEEDYE
jgi:hypothetical protein